ncbi:PUR family DNA/RNA-binding protein, partial [Tenacibaculum finnmarkense]|nr:PUR family DNA/RNA-binding protein [Tenacibaculum finnmarkense]
LYKEDFSDFKEMLNKATSFIVNEKGSEVISERHQKDYKKEEEESESEVEVALASTESFTNVSFDDI